MLRVSSFRRGGKRLFLSETVAYFPGIRYD